MLLQRCSCCTWGFSNGASALGSGNLNKPLGLHCPCLCKCRFNFLFSSIRFFLPCDYNHVHSSYHQLLLSLQVDLRHFTCSQLWITTRRRKRGILTCFEANPKNKSCFAYIPDIETKIHQCILKFIVRFPCQLLSVVLLLGLHLAVMCCLNGLKKNH